MALDNWLRRLEKSAGDGVVLHQQDGSVRVFDDEAVFIELFLTKTSLFTDERVRDSEVLDAVRSATPESRAEFERKYGSIELEVHVIGREDDGGWVEARHLREDGTTETILHEGGTEEAERIRREARASPSGKF